MPSPSCSLRPVRSPLLKPKQFAQILNLRSRRSPPSQVVVVIFVVIDVAVDSDGEVATAAPVCHCLRVRPSVRLSDCSHGECACAPLCECEHFALHVHLAGAAAACVVGARSSAHSLVFSSRRRRRRRPKLNSRSFTQVHQSTTLAERGRARS